MFTTKATESFKASAPRLGRRLTALTCAIALVVLLAGNVAAMPLARDDERHAPLVTPKLEPVPAWSKVRFKLNTTAGYKVLAFG